MEWQNHKPNDTAYKLKKINERWKSEKPLIKRKEEIRLEKAAIYKAKIQLSTSKKYVGFLFLSATIIEIFTCWIMVRQMELVEANCMSPDFSPLVALISEVVAEVAAFAIYSVKAAKENVIKLAHLNEEAVG